MRKLQATTQCNWNWFRLSAGRRVSNVEWWRATTPPTTTATISSAGHSGNFRKTCVTYFQWNIRREFKDLSGNGRWSWAGASSASSRQPQKPWGLFCFGTILSLSVSNLMCVCVFFPQQQMQLFSSCVLCLKGDRVGGEETSSMMSLTGLFVCGASWNWNGNQSWEGGNA